jgi:error-prone DNA polymerase
MSERDRVAAEYAVNGVSTGPHLLAFLREALNALGCTPLAGIRDIADGTRVRVAGLVIARQAPVSARGFRFYTLADEGAHLDLIFKPDVARRTRAVAGSHPLLMVDGVIQSRSKRLNLVVDAVTALDGDGHPIASPGQGVQLSWRPPASHDFR